MKPIDTSAMECLDFGATLTGAESARLRRQIEALRAHRPSVSSLPEQATVPEEKSCTAKNWFLAAAAGITSGFFLSACLQML